MRVLEIGYATIRNWSCDYSKLTMRLFETKKGCTRIERVHPRYIVMIKFLVRGYYEYLRIIPGLILIFLRIWLERSNKEYLYVNIHKAFSLISLSTS